MSDGGGSVGGDSGGYSGGDYSGGHAAENYYGSESGALVAWSWNQYGYDRRQDREIEALRASQRRAARRAESARAKDRRRLEQRITDASSRLAERIDVVIAWTELRFQLIEFDEYQARKEIRKTFRALAEGRPAALPEVDDVPGYWMPPAALAALDRLLAADGADAAEGVRDPDLARERDPLRSDLLAVAVARSFDRSGFAGTALPRLLQGPFDLGVKAPDSDEPDQTEPEAPLQVAAGWRALWEDLAAGTAGPRARADLTARLAEAFDPGSFDDARLREWDQALLGFGGRALTVPERYTALADHFTAEPAAADAAPLDPSRWQAYLQSLIEEPSEAEHPLVEAMECLHHPADQDRRSAPPWAATVGTVPGLLRSDLFDPAGPVALRRIAFQVAAPFLRTRLDRLRSALETVPDQVKEVRRRGVPITVRADGPDPEALAAAERAIDASADRKAPPKTAAIAVAAAFLALAALAAAFQIWILVVLAAIGALVPLPVYRRARKEHRDSTERRDARLRDLRFAVERAREALAATADAHREQTRAAAGPYARLQTSVESAAAR